MNKDVMYPLRRLHGMLHDFKTKCDIRKEFHKYFKKNPNAVFLLMTPEHGNVGDQGIAQAETVFLRQRGIKYIEVTSKRLAQMKWGKQLDVFNGFPILINGGGNLGTLWMDVESLQREIVQRNPKSKILFLPNTAFFEDNDWGQEELRKSVQVYNRHKHLTLYARERTTYDFMKPLFRDVRLIPDMVLSLKKDIYHMDRKGCLLCLRGDCEKTRTRQDEDMIRQQAAQLFGKQVTDTDMIAKGGVPVERREQVLDEKFAQFAGAELVITDRLHGMIFCAITGTPCVVVDSKSPKVRGCYEWIRHLDYIRFADNSEDIVKQYRLIPEGPHRYDNSHLIHYYQSLANDINNLWR